MLTWILLGLGAAVALVLLVILLLAAGKPSTFRIERRTEVGAPPATVFAHLEDLRRWRGWSPWEGLDPNLQRTYAGADRGSGSSYSWSGNKKAGAGTMTMTGAAADGVDIDLQFTKPFPAKNHVRIDLTSTGGGTDVAWTMTGKQNPIGKLFFALMGMEKRLSADFDKGLAQLKAVSESA